MTDIFDILFRKAGKITGRTPGRQADLAAVLDEWPQNIDNWRKRGIPPSKCELIESKLGVRCERLRPDYQWDRAPDGRVLGHAPKRKAA